MLNSSLEPNAFTRLRWSLSETNQSLSGDDKSDLSLKRN